jgi:hypothetical protein
MRLLNVSGRNSIVAALLAILAATLSPTAFAASPTGTGLVRQSVEPPYRTQLDDSVYAVSDCGPAVLGMVLDDYGVHQDTLDLRRLTHTYQGTWPAVRVGTGLQYLSQVAEDFGLASYGLYETDDASAYHQWTVDEIADQLQSGRLVIPLVRFGLLPGHENTGVRWGHYILLYAVSDAGFVYQDPAVRPIDEGRQRWISREQLDRAMAPVWPPRQAVAFGTAASSS